MLSWKFAQSECMIERHQRCTNSRETKLNEPSSLMRALACRHRVAWVFFKWPKHVARIGRVRPVFKKKLTNKVTML